MREQLRNSVLEHVSETTRISKLITSTKGLVYRSRDPEAFVRGILSEVWIEINGSNPWDPQIKDSSLYWKVALGWNLALWEAYMDELWECDDIAGFFRRVLGWGLYRRTDGLETLLWNIRSFMINLQTKTRSKSVIDNHYNLWNELYESFLDELMAYTCWYFRNWNETLQEAQEAKTDLTSDKLFLEPWMRVADIWCGWGKIMNRIAEKNDVEVVWITLSDEQYNYANQGDLVPNVSLRLWDYRDTMWKWEFDAIYTIWMMEHIGYKNYSNFAHIVNTSLKDKGRFLLHSIGANKSRRIGDPWIDKYIFRGWMLPSQVQLWKAIEPTGLILEDVHNFWPDYAKTLKMWRQRFQENFPDLQKNFPEYDQRFYRMWIYYLASMEAVFDTREAQLYQNVYSKWIMEKYTWVR